MKTMRSGIKWGRVIVATVLSEALPVVVLVLVVYLYSLSITGGKAGTPDEARINEFARQAGNWVGPLVGSIMTFFFSTWAGRKLDDHFVLQGLLIGALVAVIDLGILLLVADRFTLLFVLSNCLKVAAGAAGGAVAGRTLPHRHGARSPNAA